MRLASLWWIPALAATAVVAAFDTGADAGDIPFFLDAARTLFSSGWTDTFADASVQSGPLQLAVLGAADAVAGALAVSSLTFLAFALELGCAALLVLVLARVVPDAGRGLLLTASLGAVALGLPHGAFVDGHPAQLAIPLLWLLAAREARAGRTWLAGALVGISGGLELWGVLGCAVFALAPRARAALAGLVVEAAVVGAVFAPFVLAGEFRMFDYSWRIAEGTLPGLLLSPGEPFPWELRILQGAAALVVGASLAFSLRRSRHAAWIALAGLIATRLALDPVLYSWYWLALQTLVLVGAVEVAASETMRKVIRERSWKSQTVPIEAP
jgi:hypothetical protein